jgi:parvulin-like peptidyl-prolyl isomerase
VVSLALATGCQPASGRDPVILALGDEVVRQSDFERHVAALEAQGGAAVPADVRRALLQPWLEERVQVLEARTRGLLVTGASPEEERRAVQRLLQEVSRATVSDDEIATYYREHPADFHVAETITLRQILVATSNEAREALRRLLKEPKSFETLARSLSKGPEAAAGGLMGTFMPGQLPSDLEAAAFALPVGGLSGVVQSSLGYHILKVEAREGARDESLDQARARIRALLERQKTDESVRQFVSDLMARAKVNHEAANPSPSRSS